MDDLSEQQRKQCALVLVFASRPILESAPNEQISFLQNRFPEAEIAIVSTAGEIIEDTRDEGTLVAAAWIFEKTRTEIVCENVSSAGGNSRLLGSQIAEKLYREDLKAALVFADGYFVNGDEFVEGLNSVFQNKVMMSGGLAGDDNRWAKTLVGTPERLGSGNAVCIGLYGDNIRMFSGINQGWDLFGPERVITKSAKQVLYEIEGESALGLYKKYLGSYAAGLPGSALMFPLSVGSADGKTTLVRTVLSVDEKNQSLNFAGNIPEGSKVRFMKTNYDRLIMGSEEAGKQLKPFLEEGPADFYLVISCVGRKIVLADRVEEELEVLSGLTGIKEKTIGFFSYGEIGPGGNLCNHYLHNQTTILVAIAES